MEIGDLLKKQQLKQLAQKSRQQKVQQRGRIKQTRTKLKQKRLDAGLSLAQLSFETGINQVTLSRWETKGMTPDDKISQIRKYAQVLNLNLNKLVQSILN